jgi:hydrogenase maturation protease
VPDVLVAGIGNIFRRDDGFGSAVAERLCARQTTLPGGVRVVDYGIRGVHLQYDLLDGVAALVIVDAIPPRAGADAPGTVLTLAVDPEDVGTGVHDPHSISPAAVLGGLRAIGGELPPTYVVGCVPAETDDGIGLSRAVEAAVQPAAEAVLALVTRLATEGPVARVGG